MNSVLNRILRRRDRRIAQATLDWWDFDGSYREANGYEDDDLDIAEIQRQALAS